MFRWLVLKDNGISDACLQASIQKDFKSLVLRFYKMKEAALQLDHYFSCFDEVMARKADLNMLLHGIFFTDSNLSRFV